MTLQQLRDFIAVADMGSLRAAAQHRGVTGPALAKSLRALEEELHVSLLERRARGTGLTEYGTALLAHARLIDAQSQQAVEDIAQRRGKQEGQITVGVGPSSGVALIPDVLREFQRRYPHVRFNMVGGSYYDYVGPLRHGKMDFALVAIPEGRVDVGLQAEHLFEVDLVVACRRGHPLSHARRLEELQDAVWALTGPTEGGPGSAILRAFRQQGLPPPRRLLQCDLNLILQNLLIRSDVLCYMPRMMLDMPGVRDMLQALPIADVLPCHRIALLRRADAPLLAMADFLATLVRRHAHYLGPMVSTLPP